MDLTPFSSQVEERTPLLIITPYGTSVLEMMNIIIESLRRSQTHDVYIDKEYTLENQDTPIYQEGPGIIVMIDVADHIQYTQEIIPIYIVEWGIRRTSIQQYLKWITYNGVAQTHTSLVPTFIEGKEAPNIIPHMSVISEKQYIMAIDNPEVLNVLYPDPVLNLPDTHLLLGGWITDDTLLHINEYSPKFALLYGEIRVPCVVYCPYVEKYGLFLIHEMLKELKFPIFTIYGNDIPRNFNFLTRTSILLTDNINAISGISADIPIYIMNLDSAPTMNLIMGSSHHNNIHIYIAIGPNDQLTRDSAQYMAFAAGVRDANMVFHELIQNSRHLVTDAYNNLYITRHIKRE